MFTCGLIWFGFILKMESTIWSDLMVITKSILSKTSNESLKKKYPMNFTMYSLLFFNQI